MIAKILIFSIVLVGARALAGKSDWFLLKNARNTSFNPFNLSDSDLIARIVTDVIFKTCETDGIDGLSLMEITDVACIQTLNSTFGIMEDNVDKIFKKLDQDQNQIVSLTEAIMATLERGGTKQGWT